MENGADPMIPNNDNKETAFHYCGKSGNSEVNVFNYVLHASFFDYLFF